ncbi:MAG: diguanylate cyclase [Proteobacteria bacterium]|nr:diguanylate cyclase [Pseudomonadota bacterium]
MPEHLPKILVVDDELENLSALERLVRGKFDMKGMQYPESALEEVEKNDYQVVVSDLRMPKMLGTEFLALLAKKKPFISRVILTGHTDTKDILEAINRAEIYRYVTKPWDNEELLTVLQQAFTHHLLLVKNQELIQELKEKNENLSSKEKELSNLNRTLEEKVQERTNELKQANEKLHELVMTDSLTKVYARRAIFNRFNEEIDRASRYNRPLVAAMVDVDNFKSFNDHEGHVLGDEALKKIAQTFLTNLRKSDAVGRYGGEEFLIVLPETKIQSAKEIAERLRINIEKLVFQGQKEEAFLTVSIGLAAYPDHGKSSEELLAAADHALYVAKQRGRNQIVSEKSHGTFFIKS